MSSRVGPAGERLSRKATRRLRITRMVRRRHRVLLGAGLIACVGVTLAGMAWSGPDPVGPAAVELRGGDEEIRSLLQQLRSGISQRSIARIVPKTLSAERCEPALAEVLGSPDDPLFRPAILLAVHLEIASLAPLMRAAMPTDDVDTDRLLVSAIQSLDPWSREDLDDLLRSEEPQILAAALTACAALPAPPLSQIAAGLCASDAQVRAAALTALPASPPAAFGDELAAAVATAPDDCLADLLTALCHCPPSPAVERALGDCLRDDGDRCDLALMALISSARPLTQVEAVTTIAQDISRAVPTRARALYCLERAGAEVDLGPLASLWPQHPVLDYFAARLMLPTGHPEAVPLLLRTLRSTGEDESLHRLITSARVGARQLLADLADTSVYADPAIWEQLAGAKPAPTLATLPQSTVDLTIEAEATRRPRDR